MHSHPGYGVTRATNHHFHKPSVARYAPLNSLARRILIGIFALVSTVALCP